MKCHICYSPSRNYIESYLFYCKKCKLWSAQLKPQFEQIDPTWNELRIHAFDQIRKLNSEYILELLNSIVPLKDKLLLDVGCSDGVFLKCANQFGMLTMGIEPDSSMVKIARTKNLNVVSGLFPNDFYCTEKIDIIVFNDVFEHLPDPVKCLKACFDILKPDGLIIINLPNSDGFLFHLSLIFAKVGLKGLFKRLWQVEFYSPHLFYFNKTNLTKMAQSISFQLLFSNRLKTYTQQGLWARIKLSKESIVTKVIKYLAALLLFPFINYLFKPDCHFLVFKKN